MSDRTRPLDPDDEAPLRPRAPRKRSRPRPQPTPPVPPPAGALDDLAAPELQLNRELSWLEFNRRVLAEASDPSNPLLERLKFLAIFGSNLDEFFMKRIGGLREQLASDVRKRTPDGRTPAEQLQEIHAAVWPMLAEQRRIFREDLVPALAARGIEVLRPSELTAADRTFLSYYFDTKLYPILTPLAVDPAHPFPFISNLSLSLAVAVRHPQTGEVRFARVKVPKGPRFVAISGQHRYLPVEQVMALHLERLFPGMEVIESHPFRVTRNADVQRDEERADDLLEQIQEELRERRFAAVVRLVVVPEMPPWMRDVLCDELAVRREDVHEVDGPLGFRDLFQLAALPLDHLRFRPWSPVAHPRLQPAGPDEPFDIFRAIAAGDLLVHHPYQSFVGSVQHFIERAATDPQVVAIKQTLYRTSTDSAIAKALVRAAEAGKQVAVTIELKARFDEANNISWATVLEEAGAHVAYGVVGLKTHAKISLVVREERDGLRTYCHIGTGNYNADTANLYTDLGLFTADPVIGADVVQVFNLLTGYVHAPEFQRLLVAPVNMRRRFLELIAGEIEHQRAGRGGRIVAKMNSLEDPEIVRALYAAGRAGVEIDLLVRGICRLRPGLPGLSETIRVRSIIGRFLEHARIFSFRNGGEPRFYIGSADWMGRNLDFRVETMVPILDPELIAELEGILALQLADNVKAWELLNDGSYRRLLPAAGERARSSQDQLMELALARLRRVS
jgi:polyphosphate kinase